MTMKGMKTASAFKDLRRFTVYGFVFASVLVQPVAAQQIQVGAKVGETAPSTGTYNSLGHRDPFVSLLAPRRTATTVPTRTGTGLASFQVADVKVSGIVKKGEVWMAILEGSDKQSYVAKVKDRLADAVVKSIDATTVVFLETGEPGSFARPREVRKALRALDEVNR
jgi:Tfp pilus assembly protein PilP